MLADRLSLLERRLDTTVLLTVDEMIEALGRAKEFEYRKPGDDV